MSVGTSAVTVVESTQGPSTSTAPTNPQASSPGPDRVTLRLVPRRPRKGVKWTNETVDNEGLGRKSSKKCCIFHRRRQFGDWSDDEDSDEECDCPEDPPKGEQGGAGEGQSSAPAQ
mmetsp:Transcript_21919/g.39078  ORF Transcript_21919/g.39078 Transcript_21919/m.39078 type:complete len:116 (-) Transcript_21919:203-550(-)